MGASHPARAARAREDGYLVADGAGTPLAVRMTAGQVYEATAFEETVDAVRIVQPLGRPRARPSRLAGDKGYDIPRIRHWLRQRRVEPIIPEKHKPFDRKLSHPPAFDAEAFARRNVHVTS